MNHNDDAPHAPTALGAPPPPVVLSNTGNHRIDGPIDRRQSRRVMVDFFVQERDGERTWLHPATNLSASGIFIESNTFSERAHAGRSELDLEFQLPGAPSSIRVRGRVQGSRRVRGFGHGLAVRFVDLTDADRARLADFVSRRLAAGEVEGPDTDAAPI